MAVLVFRDVSLDWKGCINRSEKQAILQWLSSAVVLPTLTFVTACLTLVHTIYEYACRLAYSRVSVEMKSLQEANGR